MQKMIMIPEERYYKMIESYDKAIKELEKLKKALDYEKTADLLMEIIKLSRTNEGSPIDKLLWSVRCAYLIGFRDALEAYNNAVKAQED